MTVQLTRPSRWRGLRPWRRHSLVLSLGGVIYMTLGLVYVISQPSRAREVSLELALGYAPIEVWGLVFLATGVAGLVSARWPPASEKWGYTAMSSLAALWGSAYVLGVLLLDVPEQSLSGGLLWYLVAFLWWAISGLENPGRVPRED